MTGKTTSKKGVDHDLKAWPGEFARIVDFEGRAAVRMNDRNFKIGDKVMIEEYDPRTEKITGRWATFELAYVQAIDITKCFPNGFEGDTYLYGLSAPADPIIMRPDRIVQLKAQQPTFDAIDKGGRLEFRDIKLKLGTVLEEILVNKQGKTIPFFESIGGYKTNLFRQVIRRDKVPLVEHYDRNQFIGGYYKMNDLIHNNIALLAWKDIKVGGN